MSVHVLHKLFIFNRKVIKTMRMGLWWVIGVACMVECLDCNICNVSEREENAGGHMHGLCTFKYLMKALLVLKQLIGHVRVFVEFWAEQALVARPDREETRRVRVLSTQRER